MLVFCRRLLTACPPPAQGLCCFYSGQYDLTLGCFERAIATASDDSAADVWFNVAQVAIGIGDLQVAYEALKVAIACDPGHAESLNNLGVLEMRKGRGDQARAAFRVRPRKTRRIWLLLSSPLRGALRPGLSPFLIRS